MACFLIRKPVSIGILSTKGIVVSKNRLLFSSELNGNSRTLLAIVAFSALGLTVACEGDDLEDADSWLTDSVREPNASSIYNTIQECEAIFHKGDGWKSLCDRHGGWGNSNAAASKNQTCKQVDCERNAEHDVSAYFFPNGCKCKDGYTGPDPDEGLDPLPPGCEDAKRGTITCCQKNETCRGTGTRTVKGFSCRDVNKSFAALVCSGMFSNSDWKKMRADCCFDASDSGGSDSTSGNACAGAVCDREGRLKCSKLDVLDVRFYGTHYRDLQAAFHGNVGALQNHYLKNGIREGRRPNAFFSPRTYLSVHKDVAAAYGSKNYSGALDHWINHGMHECRRLK